MHILSAKNITKFYGGGKSSVETLVINDVDIDILSGSFVSIMGPSGSGKTTLLNVLSTIDKASSGDVFFNGSSIRNMSEKNISKFRKEQLGFIFQDYNLIDSLTIKENVLLPLTISKTNPAEAINRYDKIASELGIKHISGNYPHNVSGGQQQRASSARAFIHNPDIIFADEPTGALDSKSASSLLNILSRLNKTEKTTIIMVTHDSVAASYSDKVIFLKDGMIYSQLQKGEMNQKEFFDKIMDTQSVLGGISDDYESSYI